MSCPPPGAPCICRTAAKPLAGEVRHYLVEHPKARPVILELAQKIHQAEVAIVRGAEGRKTKAFVGRLSDEEALDLAGKFLDVPDLRSSGATYEHCLLQPDFCGVVERLPASLDGCTILWMTGSQCLQWPASAVSVSGKAASLCCCLLPPAGCTF